MDTDTTTLEYADLELSLDRLAPGRYRLRMTYQAPHSDAPVALYDKPNTEIALENAVLSALHLEPAAYGRSLGALLFADSDALAGFRKGFGMARSGGFGLRLRLVLDVSDPQLNDLAWETLTLPGDTTPLAQDERLALSRFLGSGDEAPVTTPMRSTLRGLAVVANPADGDEYGLSPVNAAWMLEAVREGLPAATWTELNSDGKTHLDTIVEHLRAGCDLFTLTCHGVVRDGEPWLYLETNTGMTDKVSGRTLAAAIATLPRKPLLALLASCASSGDLGGDPLRAVGPLLVQAGVPAVIAMHGAVQQATARRFLAVMRQELARHGVIDRAAAAARWAVRNEPDWWAPVVWLRLASGRLWTETPPHVRRRADFYRHIDLPPHYIRRPELLAEIKTALLAERVAGQPVALTAAVKVHVDALHGMGGIGKTVAARALCDDPDVQAAYPDGILWATVGQTPDLLPQLRDWIRELGGIVSENVPTVDSLKNLLAKLLAERACLLVADDVWRVEDAQTFLIPASNCRALITTRDAAVATEVGAAVQPVSLMAHEEALALLRAWSGKHLEKVDDARLAPVVARLGRLPLAVKLAGPHFADSDPERWRKEFDLRDLEAPRVEGAHRSLVVGFGLSLDRLAAQERQLYAALTIFPEDEPIPPVAVEKLWGELGRLTGRQVRRRLRDLADRALLQRMTGGDQGEPVVVLHDLLRDLMAQELGKAGALAAHGAIVAAYRRTQTGEGWHTTPDDGYLYAHLAYHLEKLATTDPTAAADLERLFADDEWMRARVAADDYQYDGFLVDLDRYWDMVQCRLVAQIERGEDDAALGQSVRCALIRTSINSLAGNYSPELVGQAVKARLWSAARGLSVAARVPDPERRTLMFAAVLKSGDCDPKQKQYGMQMGMEAVRSIESKRRHADALIALAPVLEDKKRQEGLDEARNIRDEWYRSRVLAAFANDSASVSSSVPIDQPSDDEIPKQQNARQAPPLSRNGELLSMTQGAEADKPEDDLIQNEVRKALIIQDGEDVSRVLTGFIPILYNDIRTTAIETAIQKTIVIRDENTRGEAIATLAQYLQGMALQNALDVTFSIQDEALRVRVLAALVPYVSGEQKEITLQRALETAYAFPERRALDRVRALTALIPNLHGETREIVLQDAFEAMLVIEDWNFLEMLPVLSLHLPGEMLRLAFKKAVAITDHSCRSQALSILAPYLPADVKVIALKRAHEAARLLIDVRWKCEYAHALAVIAPNLEGTMKAITLQEGLDAALTLKDGNEGHCSEALAVLAPNLEGNLQRKALEVAFTFQDKWNRLHVLSAFASRLSHSDHLHQTRSQIVTDLHTAFRQSTRAELLDYLAFSNLIAPPLFSPTTIAAVAEAIIDVTTQWRWL